MSHPIIIGGGTFLNDRIVAGRSWAHNRETGGEGNPPQCAQITLNLIDVLEDFDSPEV